MPEYLNPKKSNIKKVTEDPRTWSLFQGLTEAEYVELDSSVKILNFVRNQIVFRPGDSADRMYIVISGRMKITQLMPDGRDQILYIYNPGDFVGGLNILSGDHYLYLGETLEESIIGQIGKNVFAKFALNRVDSLIDILAKSFDRIRWAESLISRLSASNAEIKVAGLLISLIDSYGIKKNNQIYLKLSINREEMGSYAGLTRETMTRKLNEFRNKGYIDFIGNRTIIIQDLPALRRIIYLV
ncbi:MAG TPA: Crp/Fnr family transcriptional regulator [Clostridiaceae bacterium]|nr:Crp/Fnr family transcriptional regulator [Clostridiaceae bacterium]